MTPERRVLDELNRLIGLHGLILLSDLRRAAQRAEVAIVDKQTWPWTNARCSRCNRRLFKTLRYVGAMGPYGERCGRIMKEELNG